MSECRCVFGKRFSYFKDTGGWKCAPEEASGHFKHPNQPNVITVPGNEGKELAPGTLNAMLKKAGLK